MKKQDVKRQEPEVYLLACQLQIHLELSWTACVLIARNILTGYRFMSKEEYEDYQRVQGVRVEEGGD